MNSDKDTPISRIVKALTKVEPNELRATVLSFLFIFALMTAYFIIRPVRDAMASDWSRTDTSFLWTLTFFFSIVAVSIFGRVISTVRFSRVVPGVYIFFAGSFVAFYLATIFVSDSTLIDKSFYVWLSVFSLFNVSVFWTFMSSIFSKEQAPRLFAVIMTGASVGAIVGPSIPTFFAEDIGVMNLMLISAAILLIPVPIIGALEKLKVGELGNEKLQADLSRAKRTGKSQFDGFSLLIRDPYLLAISLFILMYVTMSTFVYMELREFLSVFERAERTQIQASIDLAVNSLALLTALFATGRLPRMSYPPWVIRPQALFLSSRNGNLASSF
jgi:AAA family ATP:ADP antiporter